jgi:hypothetical protein
VSNLMYFSMTLCNSAICFGGFLVNLYAHGPGLTLLVATMITESSVMSGVFALSWTNLR